MVRLIGVFVWALCGLGAFQNASVREASVALQRGDFAKAERILRIETADHPDNAWALSLLGYSLDQQKRSRESDPIHRRAIELSPHSAEILNNYGTHLWKLEDYARAESVFSEALAAAPTYFNVLYNLGTMASYAGHYDRAREVLRSALSQQPKNVDVLYRLASVEEASKHWEDAAILLARAGQIDPKRADVQKLLAVTASELGALPDAAAAWDHYLALEPNDDIARRERAYTAVKMGSLEEGIGDLNRYLARHADDKIAHFELGQAQRSLDANAALQHFDKALALDPGYGAAHAARGSLNYQNGDFEKALQDLEMAPKDAATLDRLGQTYQALDRTADAVPVLRRAAQLAPDDSKIVLHYGRALADAGQTEESKAVMDRFRQLGSEKKVVVPEGLVRYLSLTPEARRKDDRARLETHVREHPDDVGAQLAWLKVLVEEHDADRIIGIARRIVAVKPDAGVLAAAGHDLLEAGYPMVAIEVLQQTGVSSLDFAVATFRTGGSPGAALEIMAKVPDAVRGSDYHLARARMWEAAGKPEEAAADRQEALGILSDSARAQPDRREVLLMRATTLELVRRTDDALAQLNQIAARWPEWPPAWAAQGIVLVLHGRYTEARHALEAASALGLRNPIADFYLTKAKQGQEPATDEATYVNRFFDGGLLKP
jgi:tetratricopeptide (TPR) repeat protein